MGRKRKICGIVLSAALVAASTGALYACGDKPQLNENFEGRTVCYELPSDGSTPEDHTGIENIGYMAYRLKNQTNYYSVMEGTVNTIISQSVTSYKQYNDGVMIATDISISSLIKTAKQLCYVGDSVLWREAAKSASEWDGLNTEWKTDEPAHVTVSDFKNTYGLPATEFSVYVLNEDTVLESDDVVNNGDGTYSQTFRLSTDGEKAVYYYRQQMLETGGLDEWPEYESIEVTYTFDSDWQILQSYIIESYNAKMVMSVGCTAEYTTDYEYDTDKAVTSDYETFYSKYADKPASSPAVSGGLTPVTCLTQAFGGVLAGATTFDVQLDLDGTPIDGTVYLDLADMSDPEVRAQIGNLKVWYSGGAAYLSYGNLKAQLTVSELAGLLGQVLGGDSSEGLSLDLDTDALLGQLGAGSFTVTESKATLSAALDLLGLHLPVVFSFNMQDGTPSLDYLGAVISVSGFNVGVTVTEGKEALPALSVGEKAGYIEMSPYIGYLYELFTQETLDIAISYQADEFSVGGNVAVDLKNGAAQGDLTVSAFGAEKAVSFAYADSCVYLDLDGIEGKISVPEAIELISAYLGGTDQLADSFDLSVLLETVFSDSFANLFAMNEGNRVLKIVVNGTDLLKNFGLDFKLGSISLAASERRLDVFALGASVSVTAGNPFEVQAKDCPELLPYVKSLISLFTGDSLQAELSYEKGGVTLAGDIAIDIANVNVKGNLSLTLPAKDEESEPLVKNVALLYANGAAYLGVDGLKVKVGVNELLPALMNLLALPKDSDAEELIKKALSVDFGKVLRWQEQSGVLNAVLTADELLSAFGLNGLKLGEVGLAVSDGALTVNAAGAEITLSAGEQFTVTEAETENYLDVTDFLNEILAIVSEKQISFEGLADISVGTQTKKSVVSLYIRKGIVSWKNGFTMYLEASLLAGGTQHDFLFSAGKKGYAVAYGSVGATLTKQELPTLEAAVVTLYNRIANVVNEISEKEGETLPQIKSLDEALTLLKKSKILSGALQAFGKDIDAAQISGMLENLQILAPEQATGIVKFAFGSLTAELLNVTGETHPEFQVDYAVKGVSLSLDMKASAFEGELPAFPEEVSLMGTEDICELLDYLGSAAEMLTAENLSLSIADGKVISTEEKYREFDGVKYNFTAEIDYYAGSSFPVHIDLDNDNFWVNPDLFAHITVDVTANLQTDSEFYLDFLIMNGNGDNEELDLYLTVSRYSNKAERAHAAPLKIYLPMSELATVGASVVSVLGVDIDFLNDTLLSSWLEATTVDQLRALGKSLVSSLDMKGLIGKLINQSSDGQTEKPLPQADAFAGFVKAVTVNPASETAPANLAVVFDGAAIYGEKTAEDFTVSFAKSTYTQTNTDEDGSEISVQKGYISSLALDNVSLGKDGKEKFSFNCGVSLTCEKVSAPDLTDYYNGTGIGSLLKVIANSIATDVTDPEVISGEEAKHEYKINRNFYIEGSAELSAFGILDATVDIVAISVTLDENEKVGINFRLEYQGVWAIVPLINGDSTLDVTVKDGMVYMKRTQYTSTGVTNKKLSSPEVVYRAMPLENLFGDFLNQLAYMLNFGEKITSLMNKESTPASSDYEPDYGEQAKNALSSYTYLQNIKDDKGNVTAKEGWKIVLNGDKLTNGVMGDLNITLKTDAAGNALRGIDFNCPKLGVKGIELTANLIYRNPCGVMEKGEDGEPLQDITVPVDSLSNLLKDTIAATDWETTTYLEVYPVTTVYKAEGNTVGEPIEALVDTATKKVLGGATAPAVPAKQGHTGVWGEPVANGNTNTVTAIYTPNPYGVTFTRGEESYEADLLYGSVVRFVAGNDELVFYTVSDDVAANVFAIPAIPAEKGHTGAWGDPAEINGIYTVTAEYTPNRYPVTFTYGGQSHEADLFYGTVVRFTANSGEVKTYTISDGENEFAVPAVPYETAQSGVWSVASQSGNEIVIRAEYTPKTYTVTLKTSESAASARTDWTEENGLYVKRVTMNYQSKITVLFRGNEYASYTVADIENNEFTLPVLPFKNGNAAIWDWSNFVYGADGCTLSADYAKDTVVYHSEVALDNNGTQTIESQFNSDNYTLNTYSASGYRFLGWFIETESGWQKVETLSLTGAGEWIVVEALWASDLSITVSCVRSGSITKYQYHITANTSGGELVGAAASAVQITTKYHVYVSLTTIENNVMYEGEEETFDGLVDSFTGSTGKHTTATCTHGIVDVTYTYNGEQLYSQHKFKSITSPTKNG